MIAPRALAALLLLPGALAWNRASQLEASARGLGAQLGHRLPPVATHAPALPEPAVIDDGAVLVPLPDLEADTDSSPVVAGKGASTKNRQKKKSSKDAAAGPSVYVSERDVLRLARSRAVPASAPVAATADRPAGVQLLGVSALGVGMQDGDVITEVLGRPIHHEGEIVGMVMAARARHAASLSAVFYRGKARGTLVVAMPYAE